MFRSDRTDTPAMLVVIATDSKTVALPFHLVGDLGVVTNERKIGFRANTSPGGISLRLPCRHTISHHLGVAPATKSPTIHETARFGQGVESHNVHPPSPPPVRVTTTAAQLDVVKDVMLDKHGRPIYDSSVNVNGSHKDRRVGVQAHVCMGLESGFPV